MRFSSFIIGLTTSITFTVQAANVDEYINQLPAGANLALMVQKVGAQAPEIDYHSQQMALPASTQKVITALAALLQLGPDFRFTTTLETRGNVEGGELKGDLIARFGGDPTFKRQDVRNMVAVLKKSGVTKIDGNVLIDTSIFASHDKAPGWPWNDMTQCFSAPPAAAIVDRNCFSVSLYSAPKPNDLAFIRVASYYPVTMFSQADAGERLPGGAVLRAGRGTGRSQSLYAHRLPDPAVRSPPAGLRHSGWRGLCRCHFKDELKQAGITYTGTLLRQTQVNEPGTVIASKQSAPLHDLLKIMLKKSDNMIADTVFRMIGHARFGVPGTWRAGSDAVRQILRQQAGIDLGNTIAVDGSGLSRHNLISPATMMQVLQYIAQHDAELNFITMLPLAGHDGSLQYRAGLHAAGVDGKVSAKTGSLQGVYNLAGFITTASGQRMAFVQYLSGYAVEPADQRNRRIPLVRFESRLYKDIYQNN